MLISFVHMCCVYSTNFNSFGPVVFKIQWRKVWKTKSFKKKILLITAVSSKRLPIFENLSFTVFLTCHGKSFFKSRDKPLKLSIFWLLLHGTISKAAQKFISPFWDLAFQIPLSGLTNFFRKTSRGVLDN